MWASIGAKINTIGKLRKNRSMYLRYGHAIKSLDENTLFPDAWEITINAKDLTPNNFNTYIHHFIHGFQSNVEIIKTKVTNNAWINDIKNPDERAKLKAELDKMRQSRTQNELKDFVLFSRTDNEKQQSLLNTAYMQAGVTDYWLLDELTESQEEKRLKPIVTAAISELDTLRKRLETLRASEKITSEIQTEIDNIIAKINPKGTNNVYTKAYNAALDLAKAQYVRTRGLDEFDESDEIAIEIVERSAKIQVGTVPISTQTIMTIFEKINKNEGSKYKTTVDDIRADLEDGKLDEVYNINLWNKYADDDFKINYTGKIGSYFELTDAQKTRRSIVDKFYEETNYDDATLLKLYEWADTDGDVAKLNTAMTNVENEDIAIWNELVKQNISLKEKYTVKNK